MRVLMRAMEWGTVLLVTLIALVFTGIDAAMFVTGFLKTRSAWIAWVIINGLVAFLWFAVQSWWRELLSDLRRRNSPPSLPEPDGPVWPPPPNPQ